MKSRKNIIICLIIVAILFVYFFQSFFGEYLTKNLFLLSQRIEDSPEFKLKFKFIMGIIYVVCGIVFSRIGFILGKRKGLDPWKWAKYCFLFNLWAIFYLVLLEDKNVK